MFSGAEVNAVDRCFGYRDGMLHQYDEKKDDKSKPHTSMSLRYTLMCLALECQK